MRFADCGSRFSVISPWFVVRGSWFAVRGSRLAARGSRFAVRGSRLAADELRVAGVRLSETNSGSDAKDRPQRPSSQRRSRTTPRTPVCKNAPEPPPRGHPSAPGARRRIARGIRSTQLPTRPQSISAPRGNAYNRILSRKR
ncbi:hypothetical protein X946_4893 [Burkholderia sp. ABCPW 111]|nr:hypothetical protein X946_4893 [Burkholderia sp. ABCPW 111]